MEWALLNAIEMQADDFVGWSILDDFIGSGDPAVHLLFRDALHASSSNVRARAVEFFSYNEDAEAAPLLESLWDGDVPEWARADLITALADNGSTRYAEDFIRLTADEDPAVAVAAVEALDELDDIRALPRLLDLARAGGPFLSLAALEALSSWPESDEAFRFILESSFDRGAKQTAALRALGIFQRLEGDERLLEVLTGSEDDPDQPELNSSLRVIAGRSLEESELQGVTDAILDLMSAAHGEDGDWVLGEGIRILHNRNDPAALPGLTVLSPRIPHGLRDKYDELIEYLGRSDHTASTTTLISTECSFAPPDPDDPATRHVVAPSGLRSIRCAEGPGVAGESWLERRLPDGELVTLFDRFDRGGETWGEVDAPDGVCWVPLRLLERGAATGARPPDPLNPEIDLPAGALASKTARSLLKADVLEVLDQEDDAVAVAFHLEPSGPTLVSLLEAMRDDARRAVTDQMEDVLDEFSEPDGGDVALDDSAGAEGDDVALDEPEEDEED
ncbi:MAG TPA: HEAT repeat domain-containing protein [Candidatus Polarisedimenticolia bacterium]|nr:HEAT repeat domain-containing protein [Candidatus Polarisedimenticolia bacterium]